MSSEQYGWNRQAFWLRLLVMLPVALVAYLAIIVAWLLIVLQLFYTLIACERSEQLSLWVTGLGRFIGQAFSFLCFASESKPFPFGDWPSSDP
ncbi:DUF4389 domain-containing protein [Halioxenophilus sp. WMMB6]|uniref:DUF4389 domain-containing protein n=1 Tax=Halioxenophilus sp. WMMB6 TaxID=3073815 RepID=UPI00295EECCE|nr:DUF4389 domain-containing protein [Halioxenophilus sp. WMMB6]